MPTSELGERYTTHSLEADMIDAGSEYIAEAVRTARQRLDELEEQVRDKAHDATRATEYFVRKHPWQSVGLAAGIGLIVGVLISRR